MTEDIKSEIINVLLAISKDMQISSADRVRACEILLTINHK